MSRYFFLAVGFLSMAVGLVGLFVPLLPTTCFVLFAAYCFSKSSDQLHRKLILHPKFGPVILAWQKHRVIRVPVKCWASTMISVSALLVFFQPLSLGIKVIVSFFLLGLVFFIWACPSQAPQETEQA